MLRDIELSKSILFFVLTVVLCGVLINTENIYAGEISINKDTGLLQFFFRWADTSDFYPPTNGKTYYVGPDGNDSNSTEIALNYETPWKTIQRACNSVMPGDIVVVKDGLYEKQSNGGLYVVDLRRGGRKGNWIVFRAENKWKAKISGNNYSVHSGWNFEDEANYVWIEGFEIYGFSFSGFWNNHDCHDIYLYNNHIYSIGVNHPTEDDFIYGRAGIMINHDSRNITVDNCVIHDIGRLPMEVDTSKWSDSYKHDHGIYAQGDNLLIKNNIIYNCYAGWPIKVDGNDFGITENSHTIERNIFAYPSNPKREGHIRFYRNPELKYNPQNVIIKNNIFYKPPGSIAISMGKDYSAIIRNNLLVCDHLFNPDFKDTQNLKMKDNIKLELKEFSFQ